MKTYFYKCVYLIVYAVVTFLFQSCDDSPALPSRKAVIEGYFRSGEYPSVFFTSSVVPEMSGNVADAIVNWGKVSISDGDTTVILTGRADDSYMPPYVYFTFDMTGIPGKTYSITAEFKDLRAHASMRMPYPVEIDSITITPAANDSLRSASLHFTSPAETPAYFYISLKKNQRGERMLPCMMGTVKTDLPGAHYSIPILRPRVKTDSIPYISQLIVGEEWIVSLNRIECSAFEFWKAYDNMVMFSNSPFITTSESLPTNIDGGLGIWSVEGSSQKEISVR